MKYMKDWETSKKRIEAFWNREIIDRCCIAVEVRSKDMVRDIPNFDDDNDVYDHRTNGERVLKREITRLENTYFAGDAFPQVFINLGAIAHAGCFKNADYKFKDTIWHFPSMKEISDELVFDNESIIYKKIIEFAKYFSNESNGDFFISQPDTSGNIDALASLRGTENLLMDMVLEPDDVHKALSSLDTVWHKINQEVYDLVKDNNEGGSTIGWLNTWAPSKLAQLQGDISVMLSTDMFEEFILPELLSQLKWTDYSLYHLDGVEQIPHLDVLLPIKELDCIQWNHVDGQPSPVNYINELQRIQQAGKCLYIHAKDTKDIPILMENLSSKGLMITTEVKTNDKADDIVKLVEKLTKE